MFILTTFLLYNLGQFDWNRIGGVMVSELDSSEIACELDSSEIACKQRLQNWSFLLLL